jgi:hypothetical protein
MAFNPENKIKDFYSRTNKLANESNGLKISAERQYCDQLEFVGDFVVNSGAGTVTFTPAAPTDAYDFRYFQIVIVDESGNQASNTGTGVIASLAVDVSGLNLNDDWQMTIYASDDAGITTDCGCKSFGQIDIDAPSSDPTVSVNTVLQDAQVIAVFEADGTTAVADAGAAYALGSYPAAGGSEAQSIVIKNTGEFVLKLSAIAISADVDAVTFTNPTYIYPGQSETVAFTIDTSGVAGAKTGDLTITSDDPANASYVVNVSFTLT